MVPPSAARHSFTQRLRPCRQIGTYKLAVCARENGVPVYAAVPTRFACASTDLDSCTRVRSQPHPLLLCPDSTLDLTMPNGDAIPIEERSADEVTHVAGGGGVGVVAPEGVPVYNPAFDVTPAKYITGAGRPRPSAGTGSDELDSLVLQASSPRSASATRLSPSRCATRSAARKPSPQRCVGQRAACWSLLLLPRPHLLALAAQAWSERLERLKQ